MNLLLGLILLLQLFTVTVVPNGLNVRNGPSTNNAIVTSVRQGDELQVLTGDIENIGNSTVWFRIQTPNGTIGYVRADLVCCAVEDIPDTGELIYSQEDVDAMFAGYEVRLNAAIDKAVEQLEFAIMDIRNITVIP